MHNNFYFLRQLSRALHQAIQGFTLTSCFTQNKEELILEFTRSGKSFYIKASLTSAFCCLSFPEGFNRARKNSVDLFTAAVSRKVEDIRQFENERSFAVTLQGNWHLLFKMHGNRANVILLENNTPVEIFRNHLQNDLDFKFNALDRTIDWSKEHFVQRQATLKKTYFTFGKEVWTYMDERGFEKSDLAARWKIIQETIRKLEDPVYRICEKQGKLLFMLVPLGRTVEEFNDPVAAINAFYYSATISGTLFREKTAALKKLSTRIESGKLYIQKNRQKLTELLADSHFQAWGDLIMANMSLIRPGLEKIIVEDLYNDHRPVEIKLKKNLSAQKNAADYYRKAKNQLIEIQQLKDSIAIKEKDLEQAEREIGALENETDLKSLRKKIEETGIIKTAQKQNEALPYRTFEYKGFQIWVGKNADSNDELTLKRAFKEDLWLHAKDVAGSHVLIKHQAGKNFPKDVIERAAGLAAHFSKRKNESLCPVAVTPKKYVRKRKGDPPGTVVVEREKVMLVKPSL